MNTVLCFSGGLDSTILLAHLMSQGHLVRCLSVNYGQRHYKELTAARNITNFYGVEHKIADLSSLTLSGLLSGSSQTDSRVEVPDGHYTEESMKATVVPNRNMILLAVATAWAVSTKSDHIAYAAHSGDHAIYPDCREEFAAAMASAIKLCDWHTPTLIRPFVSMTKTDLVKRGAFLNVPFQYTWSCYKGKERHCGKCGTCNERIEAFKLSSVYDPTLYAKA